MDFTSVDKKFSKWVNDPSLQIYTKYKGEEARSVEIQDVLGKKWQL